MKREYESGTFCRDIGCERHARLDGVGRDGYLDRKEQICGDCYAWRLFRWLGARGWRIVLTEPEISAHELAARIKGIDPVRVGDLTEDEILCL